MLYLRTPSAFKYVIYAQV